jgi:hypothetical protein
MNLKSKGKFYENKNEKKKERRKRGMKTKDDLTCCGR